jgi:hypothetical protein
MVESSSNNVVETPATGSAGRMDSTLEMLKLARQATARIVTAALEATAESADMERAARAARVALPARATQARNLGIGGLDDLPAELRVDPQRLRDFTRGAGYLDLVERYVRGKIEGHLLPRAMALLAEFCPLLIGG